MGCWRQLHVPCSQAQQVGVPEQLAQQQARSTKWRHSRQPGQTRHAGVRANCCQRCHEAGGEQQELQVPPSSCAACLQHQRTAATAAAAAISWHVCWFDSSSLRGLDSCQELFSCRHGAADGCLHVCLAICCIADLHHRHLACSQVGGVLGGLGGLGGGGVERCYGPGGAELVAAAAASNSTSTCSKPSLKLS